MTEIMEIKSEAYEEIMDLAFRINGGLEVLAFYADFCLEQSQEMANIYENLDCLRDSSKELLEKILHFY